MKALLRVRAVATALVVVFTFSVSYGQKIFKAHLSGQNEVTPVATLATGEVTAVLSGQRLTLWGSFSGLSGNLATDILGGGHLHLGMAGQTGEAAIPIRITPDADMRGGTIDPRKNTLALTIAQMSALLQRGIYVNIHSQAFRTGEIRGQLLPRADEYFHANLFGSNEVPAAMTNASGAVDIEVRGNEVTLSGSFRMLEGDFAFNIAGGVHIHNAMAGQNGPIVINLDATVSDDNRNGRFATSRNTFTLTDAQLDAMRARAYYVNIHSDKFPGGELRGQIVGQSRSLFRAHLAGVNQATPVVSTASGVVLAEVLDDETVLVTGSFKDLTSDLATQILGGAHIHRGMAGMTGPVEFSIVPTLNADRRSGIFRAADNELTLNGNQMNNLINRAKYVNIHSQNIQSGEIRGQLLHESALFFTGLLSSNQEAPPAVSAASGTVKAELSGNNLVLSGSFNGLESDFNIDVAGGAHIHQAMAGQSGPIQVTLTTTTQPDNRSGRFAASNNSVSLSDDQVLALRQRGMYINIHSQGIPSGELRAQLLFEAENYFYAILSGVSENPAVNTAGRGMAIVEVTDDSGVITGGFSELSAPFDSDIARGAHIHRGIAGVNGPIEAGLRATVANNGLSGIFSATDNHIDIDDSQFGFLRARLFYVNIHSQAFASGEIRGQLLPPSNATFTTRLSGVNEVPAAATPGAGNLKIELLGNQIIVTGSFSDMQGDFDVNIAGGSHLHIGEPNENGPITIGLNPTLDNDLKGGMFLSENNTFTINPAGREALKTGGLYANLHSTDFPAGELRGQVLPAINFFPSADANITAPADGAAITIEGPGASPFGVEWADADDDNALVYVWQLSATEDFSSLIFETNKGSVTTFMTDFATVDGLLASAGVGVGETITLFHRVVASDGSVRTPSPTASLVITRGVLDGNRPFNGKVSFDNEPALHLLKTNIFPNPSSDMIFVDFHSDRTCTTAQLQVFDVRGTLIEQMNLAIQEGYNRWRHDISNWKDGVYTLRISDGKTFGESYRIVKTSGF